MCGICVAIGDEGAVNRELLTKMCDRIVHRGPNSSGFHVQDGVALGMRRLSVIDLEGGDQPIYNEDRSLVLVFNGEIYNFKELRKALEARGHRFRSSTDGEVVVHLYEEYKEQAVEKLRGMYGFAVFERDTGRLFCARDRLGIKPLYVMEQGSRLFVVSEMKSLLAIKELAFTLDELALDQYVSLLYILHRGRFLRRLASCFQVTI